MVPKKLINIADTTFDLHEYGVNVQTREIFMHPPYHAEGAAYEDQDELDFREAVTFIKNLSLLNACGTKNILVHQESAGGDWNHGMAIYDAIKASKSPVTILAYAHARSMTSITLQAANLRIMMPNCDFLVHYGQWATADRVVAALSQADQERKTMKKMLEVYANRCVKGPFFRDKSRRQVISYIAGRIEKRTDWIMSAKEAVDYGFADGVFGQGKYRTLGKIRCD